MRATRYVCDQGKHHHPLADLTEVQPAVFLCTEHLTARDRARDQWAAQTSTSPLDRTTQMLLGIWHAEQERQKHGGASW